MLPDVPYVMSPTEIVCGQVFGSVGPIPPPSRRWSGPVEALEHVVAPYVRRAPCGVAFSGGRDSSLVLAVATAVARRDGLADPIPITLVFPGSPESDEQVWQELVVRHLGLTEWIRIEAADELDILGPLAQERVRRHGVLWTTTLSRDVPLMEVVRGGSLLDGEGGDEVLGDHTHRVAALAWTLRHPRPVTRRRWRMGLTPLAPVGVRIAGAHVFWNTATTPWLTAAGRALLLDALAAAEAASPLRFDTSVRRVPMARHNVLVGHNRRLFARDFDVALLSPLLHTDVVNAIADAGGWLGPGDRTDALRSFAGALLPDEVLSRTSKADFTDAYLGARTRAFGATWDGTGVDTELVDVEELRMMWRDGVHHSLTTALLQQAWLASCGNPVIS